MSRCSWVSVIGCGIGALGCASWKEVLDNIPGILGLGIKMGAVMELIPYHQPLYRGFETDVWPLPADDR